MAYYRLHTLFDQGVLNDGNKARAVIIKTFVTTDLQSAIADALRRALHRDADRLQVHRPEARHVRERAARLGARRATARSPRSETRALRLAESSFYVFGGEESYGYSGADFVRDKDANGACVMFAEVAAYAKSQGMTLPQLLDEIYAQFGFYLEKLGTLTLEGADGAAKIQKLLASYDANPPRDINGRAVRGREEFREGNVPRRRRPGNPEGKDAHVRDGGRRPGGRARFGHGAEDQVLPVRQPPARRGQDRSRRRNSRRSSPPWPDSSTTPGHGCKPTRKAAYDTDARPETRLRTKPVGIPFHPLMKHLAALLLTIAAFVGASVNVHAQMGGVPPGGEPAETTLLHRPTPTPGPAATTSKEQKADRRPVCPRTKRARKARKRFSRGRPENLPHLEECHRVQGRQGARGVVRGGNRRRL